MKLVFLMPANSGGGIEVSIPLIAENIDPSSFESIHLIGINSLESERIKKVKGKLSFHGLGRLSGDPISTIRSFSRFVKFVTELEGEVIVVANGEVAEVFVWLTRKKYKKIIVVEHTSKPWQKLRWLGYLIRRTLNRCPATWVSVILDSKVIWPSITSFVWIPNPLTIPIANIATQQPMSGLIFLGRLIKSKNPGLVCHTARTLGVRLDVFGSGSLEDSLKSEYSLDSNIVFHGHIENVWERILNTGVLVVASEFEGDGRVIAEAIIRSQPILVFDTYDHRRFSLPDANYFKDERELYSKILRTLKEGIGDLLPPGSVRKELISQRSIDVVAKEWNKLFRSFL